MRFYGRKSGRNRPGARFARSYFYYSKRKGCRNNTTTQTRNNGGLSDGSSYGKVEASSEFIMFMGVLFIAIIILGIFAVVVSPQAEKGDMIALLVVVSILGFPFIFVGGNTLLNNIDVEQKNRSHKKLYPIEPLKEISWAKYNVGFVDEEIDSSIREVLKKREEINHNLNELEKECMVLTRRIIKTAKDQEKLSEIEVKKKSLREELESEKYILKTGRTNKKYKTFQDSMNYLKAQKSIVHEGELSKPLYDVFVDVAAVFTHVSYLKKDTEVICLNLGERIHVITPLVILEISASDYSFIAAYKHGAFCIDRTSVEWKERHEYYTWLHARRDGGPDLRYSYNPQQLNYSYSTHRTDNAICIRIGEKSEKYEIEKKTRDYIMKYKNQFQLT